MIDQAIFAAHDYLDKECNSDDQSSKGRVHKDSHRPSYLIESLTDENPGNGREKGSTDLFHIYIAYRSYPATNYCNIFYLSIDFIVSEIRPPPTPPKKKKEQKKEKEKYCPSGVTKVVRVAVHVLNISDK